MRKIILAGTAVVVIGVVAGGIAVTKAGAQPDPAALELALNDPQPGSDPAMPPPPPPPGHPGPGWIHGPMAGGPMAGGPMMHRPMWHRAGMFGLFFQPADKQLTPADVQKIAEAFLLWQGNRDWKVTQVAASPDGKIGFDFATSDGGVIARFTMDSRTGRIARVG